MPARPSPKPRPHRYEKLAATRVVSAESVDGKRQEAQVARAATSAVRANLEASRQELERVRAERDGLVRQRANLRLLAPIDGLVSRREADPGTTVVAGSDGHRSGRARQHLDPRPL